MEKLARIIKISNKYDDAQQDLKAYRSDLERLRSAYHLRTEQAPIPKPWTD